MLCVYFFILGLPLQCKNHNNRFCLCCSRLCLMHWKSAVLNAHLFTGPTTGNTDSQRSHLLSALWWLAFSDGLQYSYLVLFFRPEPGLTLRLTLGQQSAAEATLPDIKATSQEASQISPWCHGTQALEEGSHRAESPTTRPPHCKEAPASHVVGHADRLKY